MFLKIAAAGMAMVLASGVAFADAQKVDKPFLWKACDSDSCVYLLGTFHALKKQDTRIAPEVASAQAQSDRFFFEVDPAETKNPMRAGMAFLEAAIRTDGSRLDDDLTPALQRKLRAVLDKHGQKSEVLALLNGEGRQQLEVWYVALLLTLSGVEKGGLDPVYGLDKQMEGRLSATDASVRGLESMQDQIDVFDALGKKAQIQLLEESLDSFEKGPAVFAKLRNTWLAGDERAAWTELGSTTKKNYPELYQRIQTDRNTRWVQKIENTMAEMKSGNAMVIVGTLHLLGDDSVIAMLKRNGHTVERVCAACNLR